MPIRIQLLLLLLCLSLPPVLIVGFYSWSIVDEMGQTIIDRGRKSLIERDKAYLEEKVADMAALLAKHISLAEQVLRSQARAVEKALLQPPPPAGTETIPMVADFDAGQVATERLPRYERADTGAVLPVSLQYSVFLLPEDGPTASVGEDIRRLNALTDTYRSLYDTQGLATLWHYTGLENGLHNSFPGHGGYPRGFDPRQRPWYRKAVAAGKLIWTDTVVDATTGGLIVTGAMPVYGPDGRLAGVTALDLTLKELFRVEADDPMHWLQSAQLMVLVAEQERLRVVAQRDYRSQQAAWDEPLAERYLLDPDKDYSRTITSLNTIDPVASYQAPYRDDSAFWAVTPIRNEASYLALVFPLADLTASATRAARFVEGEKQTHLATVGMILVVVTVAVVAIALLAAHRVTNPLQDIAATAKAIAGGKLESRTMLERRDEIGSLATDINAMASAIEKLQKDQETAHLQMIRSLTSALEKKDAYTAAHSGRVAKYSVKLGKRRGLDDDTLELLKHGALTHDLGKIGVPDAILNKPSPLDDDEFVVMSQHPEHTARIMRPLIRFNAFTQIAAWHHERWDGRGYPDGLKGEEIPLLARIVSIADTWDAMTGDRVYRKGMKVERALSILEAERDSGQWDPHLLREFIDMIREEMAANQKSGVSEASLS